MDRGPVGPLAVVGGFDQHGLDPRNPRDSDLVAYVQARALVGISYGSIGATLTAAERVLGDPDLVRPARRHLGNLYADGVIDGTTSLSPTPRVGAMVS